MIWVAIAVFAAVAWWKWPLLSGETNDRGWCVGDCDVTDIFESNDDEGVSSNWDGEATAIYTLPSPKFFHQG